VNLFILFDNPIFDEDCEDVDECTETDPGTGNPIHDCDPNATCTNIGSNSQTGYTGFILDGRKHRANNILYRK